MGQSINAFIGKDNVIAKLADDWIKANAVVLKQGYSMVCLTDELFDDITELSDVDDDLECPELTLFTHAICDIMQEYSRRAMLAYIETDCGGGVGTQAGVLFENGDIIIKPTDGKGNINAILHKLGVYCESGRDEFDSLGLGRYRHNI